MRYQMALAPPRVNAQRGRRGGGRRAGRRFGPGYTQQRFDQPARQDNSYGAAALAERRVDGRVRNADLPDLRAAFLQKIVAETYPTKPPTILEGAVSPKTDNRDRHAELIMDVDW